MSTPEPLFNPPIQPNGALTGVEKYLLRVLSGWAGKTILHRGSVVEILETAGALRRLQPLIESDLSESDRDPFWVPRRALDRRKFTIERLEKRGRRFTIGKVEGGPRPKAISRQLETKFPDGPYLRKLVRKWGYDKQAAMACMPQSYTRFLQTGGRYTGGHWGIERQELVAGQPVYYGADIRHTTRGGGNKAETVVKVIGRHRWADPYPYAVFRTVYQGQKGSQVAEELGVNLGTLYVYSSQVENDLRELNHA